MSGPLLPKLVAMVKLVTQLVVQRSGPTGASYQNSGSTSLCGEAVQLVVLARNISCPFESPLTKFEVHSVVLAFHVQLIH